MKASIISPEELVNRMEEPSGNLIIVDCRSGIEYLTWHITGSINIGGSRSTRREIMNGQVTVLSLLHEQIGRTCNKEELVVVYDQCSVESINAQSLSGHVVDELSLFFKKVRFLRGGFIGFQSKFANLCWTNKHKMPDEDFVTPSQTPATCDNSQDSSYQSVNNSSQSLTRSHTMLTLTTDQSSTKCLDLHNRRPQASLLLQQQKMFVRQSLSGPALSSNKEGPTTVLQYLLLGTQQDAMTQSCILKHGITHVINVSTDGLMCPFVSPHNFIRIPVLDNFVDKITPYFPKAFKFLDDVKMIGGRALVHCSAGISRSPTLAIGYLMKTMNISVTEAYNIVKSSRTSVSPNFNFMGQLTDYEKVLRTVIEEKAASTSSSVTKSTAGRLKRRPSRLGFLSTLLRHRISTSPTRDSKMLTPTLPSPSVPFAKLGINSPMEECPGIRLENFPATSLDQLHFQPCQTGQRGIKIKRSATQVDNDPSQIRKRLSIMESCDTSHTIQSKPDVLLGSRRHSSVFPVTVESANVEPSTCLCDSEKPLCLSGRSVSYERINSATNSANNSNTNQSMLSDSCRIQECHQSTSSLSSANSHNSNLLV